jgi:hypothetical protein
VLQVLLLLEGVSEAQRLAALQVKESEGPGKGRNKKGGGREHDDEGHLPMGRKLKRAKKG